jgi:hypothetical protein
VLPVTHYYAPVPATVHNAIDWPTMRWNGSKLHEKPHAVMGYSADCYRGIWSHSQSGQRREISESRIIGPIRVSSLREAVAKLAGEVSTVEEVAGDFARDTNCASRHHRRTGVVPRNNCAGLPRSNNELLARPPRTTFVKELL